MGESQVEKNGFAPEHMLGLSATEENVAPVKRSGSNMSPRRCDDERATDGYKKNDPARNWSRVANLSSRTGRVM